MRLVTLVKVAIGSFIVGLGSALTGIVVRSAAREFGKEADDMSLRGSTVGSLYRELPEYQSTLEVFNFLHWNYEHQTDSHNLTQAFHTVLDDPCAIVIEGEAEASTQLGDCSSLKPHIVRTDPGGENKEIPPIIYKWYKLLEESRTTTFSHKINPHCRRTKLSETYGKKYEKLKKQQEERKPIYDFVGSTKDSTIGKIAFAAAILKGRSIYKNIPPKRLDIERQRRKAQLNRQGPK